MVGKSSFGQCVRQNCNGTQRLGVALKNTLVGYPDFPGDQHCVTLHAGGPGTLVCCLKCDVCGHSLTTNHLQPRKETE